MDYEFVLEVACLENVANKGTCQISELQDQGEKGVAKVDFARGQGGSSNLKFWKRQAQASTTVHKHGVNGGGVGQKWKKLPESEGVKKPGKKARRENTMDQESGSGSNRLAAAAEQPR